MTDNHCCAGLYLHLPFCDGKCGYCAFYSVPYEVSLADRLLAALENEIALSLNGGSLPGVRTVYIGGGTPSILASIQLDRLCGFIRSLVSPSAPLEWTVEMNPGSITADKLAALIRAGVNRISLGAQSFHDGVLEALGRRHSAADIFQAVELVRRAGVENFGLDLIAGVPGFGADVWRSTLEQAVALDPRHVSVYALTGEEGTRLGQALGRGEIALLTDDQQLAALDTAECVLTAAGYRRYEISNYARPGYECRHHCDCWRGGEYLGLGPAAASHIGLERWTNRPDLTAYLEALEQGRLPPREHDPLSPALAAMEKVVFGLRLAEGIGVAIAAPVEPILRRLQAEGLVALNDCRWTLTRRGRELADAVGVEIMAAADRPAL